MPMSPEKSKSIEQLNRLVSEHMDEMLGYFKASMLITVMIRDPENPEAEFLMTNDDLDQVIAMVGRRQAAAVIRPTSEDRSGGFDGPTGAD